MRDTPKLFVVLLAALLLWGCSEEVQRGLRPIPSAYGRLNQVIVVADKALWEGHVGDSIRLYYSSAYPILPQPEPIFDLRYISPEEMLAEPLKKELSTYLMVANLSDENSATTQLIMEDLGSERALRAKEEPDFNSVVGRDKWAKGQILVYQFAHSPDVLAKNIVKNFPAISARIAQAAENRVDATAFFSGENKEVMEEVKALWAADIRIPSDYKVGIKGEDFLWLRKETSETSSNIMLHRVKYTHQSQLTKAGLKAIRDSLGRAYVSSTLPNTYMQINDVDLPLLTNSQETGQGYLLEAKGIWEIVNDFMGGAFVSHLIHNPGKDYLLFVDGFLHAPGKDKRDLMQQLEYIVKTTRY